MPEVVTIGVYGFTAETFLRRPARVRRGRRSSTCASAVACAAPTTPGPTRSVCRPPSPLPALEYRHHKQLAPTTELRRLQYREDDRHSAVGKRSRSELAPEYRDRYVSEILDRVELAALVESLPAEGAAALMCVEADPEACHRSLIAQRMADRFGVAVRDLRPAG